LLKWFDLDHLGRSAGQFDEAKLRWVNAQHLKAMADAALAPLVRDQLKRLGFDADDTRHLAALEPAIALFKDRCATTVELAEWLGMYFVHPSPAEADLQAHVTDAVKPALRSLRDRLSQAEWTKDGIAAAIKATLAEHGLKMPQLAMAVRVLVCGRPQTPSLDAVLSLFPRDSVLARLQGV
jgi:glutamyl-tRNA synthetase